MWSVVRRGVTNHGSVTSRRSRLEAPHQGLEVLDALEIIELSTEQLLDAMQQSPRQRKRKSSRALPGGSRPSLLSCDNSGGGGRTRLSMSSGLTAPRLSAAAKTPVQAALARAVSESRDPALARELGTFARELNDGRVKAPLTLPPVGLRPPWRPQPRERPTTAQAQAHVETATWRRPAAALAQSQSAPVLSSGQPHEEEGAVSRGKGWAKAAGLTREQAADRAGMLRHRVAQSATEIAARQERKRAAVRMHLERLRVTTPQYAAGRDLPRMDLPLDDGWPGDDKLPEADPAVPNWGVPPTVPSTSMYPPRRGRPVCTLPVLVTTKSPTTHVYTDSAHAEVHPEVRVHLRVHPHFVAHVPAHQCRSMVAVDGDRETLRTDLQRIKMPTSSEASGSLHMLAGGAARIIGDDSWRSRASCA
jgi:hypothetical protein